MARGSRLTARHTEVSRNQCPTLRRTSVVRAKLRIGVSLAICRSHENESSHEHEKKEGRIKIKSRHNKVFSVGRLAITREGNLSNTFIRTCMISCCSIDQFVQLWFRQALARRQLMKSSQTGVRNPQRASRRQTHCSQKQFVDRST